MVKYISMESHRNVAMRFGKAKSSLVYRWKKSLIDEHATFHTGVLSSSS